MGQTLNLDNLRKSAAQLPGPPEPPVGPSGSNLKPCPGCTQMVSRKAVSCPSCGEPIRRRKSPFVPGVAGLGCLGLAAMYYVMVTTIAARRNWDWYDNAMTESHWRYTPAYLLLSLLLCGAWGIATAIGRAAK